MKSTIYSGQHIAHQCAMPESSFDDVNLYQSVFNNVNLASSGFSAINLTNSVFYDTDLSHTNITAVNLSGAKFKHILTSITNQQGEIKTVPIQFEDADLSQSRFENVNLSDAQFENCTIDGLVINGVNIQALLNGEQIKPKLSKIGWRTQNDTGSTNKISKSHFSVQGSNKTLCGVDVPNQQSVAQMSDQIGTGVCKRCLHIKKTY
jgi:uncharacterized protein YjbI with pentapeptide repeats